MAIDRKFIVEAPGRRSRPATEHEIRERFESGQISEKATVRRFGEKSKVPIREFLGLTGATADEANDAKRFVLTESGRRSKPLSEKRIRELHSKGEFRDDATVRAVDSVFQMRLSAFLGVQCADQHFEFPLKVARPNNDLFLAVHPDGISYAYLPWADLQKMIRETRLPATTLIRRAGCKCELTARELYRACRDVRKDFEIKGRKVSAAQAYEFVIALPLRPVTHSFPEMEESTPLQDFVSVVERSHRDEPIVDDHESFFVYKLMRKDGWLCVEWQPIGLLAFEKLRSAKDRGMEHGVAQNVFDISTSFLSRYEVGIERNELRQALVSLKETSSRLQLSLQTTRWLRILVSNIEIDLTHSLNAWNADPGYANISFIGGGFGLKGAVKGILAAGALNTVVGLFNSRVRSKHAPKFEGPLHAAASKLFALRALAADRLETA